MTSSSERPATATPAVSVWPAAWTGVLVRVAFLVTIFVVWKYSWQQYLETSDASSFLPVAHDIAHDAHRGPATKLYDTRVFPGWTLLLAAGLRMGLPETWSLAALFAFVFAAPVLYFRLTADRTGAWLLAAFPPAWLLATFHPISEAAYFCVIVLGAMAVRREAWTWAGLAGGALLLMRPFGVAWIAAYGLVLLLTEPNLRKLAGFSAGVLAMVAVLLGTNYALYHDCLRQLHVYAMPLAQLNVPNAGEAHGHWGWPFVNLVTTPLMYSVPWWKTLYVGVSVAGFLAAAVAAVLQLRRGAAAWKQSLLLGFLFNTALSFCTGPYWAFHSVDRYLIWGLPGALAACEPWWRRRPLLAWTLAVASLALAVLCTWKRFRGLAWA